MPIPDLPDPTSTQDVFASRTETRLNQTASRLMKWLFQPPYLPGSFIWFLFAIITSHIALELMAQPDGYWADPSISTSINFLYVPFSWGSWILILYMLYLLLIGVLISVLHKIPAFAAGMFLLTFHLPLAISYFDCRGYYFSEFMNPGNCSAIYTGSTFLIGILFAIGILIIAGTDIFPWLKASHMLGKMQKFVTSFAVAWMVIMVFAAIYDGFQSRISWKPVEVDNLPPARTASAFAYDTQRSVAVVFGGTTSWSPDTEWNSVNDTWEWNGREWKQIEPAHVPPARLGAGAAYDEKRGVTVVFGGSGKNENQQLVFFDDTWEWDGKDWIQRTPEVHPLPRQAPSMYYDPIREVVVIYGGYYFDPITQNQVFHDDVWFWDGETWQEFPMEQSRRSSSGATLFDPFKQTALYVDGEDLWTLQDTFWLPLNFSRRPSNRWGGQMAYDPTGQVVILFGGYKDDKVFDDTWVYDGQDWRQIIPSDQPSSRHGSVLFYDQVRGSILLFSGLNGGNFYQDMWELDLQ